MEYRCLKLMTGETLIGVLESEDTDEYINISSPIQIEYGYDQKGNFGLKFLPFMSYCDTDLFTFKRSHVILILKPTKNTIDYYITYCRVKSTEDIMEDEDEINISDFAKSFSIH